MIVASEVEGAGVKLTFERFLLLVPISVILVLDSLKNSISSVEGCNSKISSSDSTLTVLPFPRVLTLKLLPGALGSHPSLLTCTLDETTVEDRAGKEDLDVLDDETLGEPHCGRCSTGTIGDLTLETLGSTTGLGLRGGASWEYWGRKVKTPPGVASGRRTDWLVLLGSSSTGLGFDSLLGLYL